MLEIPLFNQRQLAEAFGFLLPQGKAEGWAAEWFRRFGDSANVTEDGYYIYQEWVLGADAPTGEGSAAFDGGDLTDGKWLDEVADMSADEKAELLLMRFSDLHLQLLALVSPDLANRVQLIHGDSEERAERRRNEVMKLINALRG